MDYEFGVGSEKWTLKAKNEDIAFVTMVMFIGQSKIPIAIYKPFRKVIDAKVVLDMNSFKNFVDKNHDDLVSCRESIYNITPNCIWDL